ncbi:MAG: serine/threonine protein kinase, partial [Spirulinaceae cyanobacterium]
MSYCINPDCPSRRNSDDADLCQTCGTDLVLQGQYRVLSPLVPHDPRRPSDLYEVEDQQNITGDRKILKVLKWQDPKYVELFEREALTLQDLDHPGIPKGYGLFKFLTAQNEELYCFVMDKMPGQDLAQWIRNNRRPSEHFVLNCLRQLIRILDYLHRSGYLHRDIKPANIMIADQQVALIDFGSVQAIAQSQTRVISDGYTAPEQVNREAVPLSDIYALGRTIVHLVTGMHPIQLKYDYKTKKL